MQNSEEIRFEVQNNPPDLQKLEHEITELAAHLYAGTYRWLCLLREFDERDGWAGWGICSCAHWLNWKCGIGMCAAREKLRVAHALKDLPEVSAAFASGSISYSKARAITRVGTPDNEGFLLQIAQGGTASQLERLVRTYRRVRRDEELDRANRQHDRRKLQYYYDEDGSFVLRLRVPGEQGAMIVEALHAAMEVQQNERRERERSEAAASAGTISCDSAETSPRSSEETGGATGPIIENEDSAESSVTESHADTTTWHAYDSAETPDSPGLSAGESQREDYDTLKADALTLMCESFLARGAGALSGGERALITVHVDAGVLADPGSEGRCELEDGPWIASDTARRLACDASVVRLTEDERGNPLDVGRRTRSIPPAIRRAMNARDRGCRFPGCTRKRYVDGHHVKHWANGGETCLGNLISLCRYHHRLVHEGGFRVMAGPDGDFSFTRPDGIPITIAPGVPNIDARNGTSVRHMNDDVGLGIDEQTCIPEWYGDLLDMDLAVSALYQCDEPANPAHVWD